MATPVPDFLTQIQTAYPCHRDRYQQPVIQFSAIKEVTGWLNQGDCVVLCAEGTMAQIYHTCTLEKVTDKTHSVPNDGIRVISIDLTNCKSSLTLDKWPNLLESVGKGRYHYCFCDLKGRVEKGEERFPYSYKVSSNEFLY